MGESTGIGWTDHTWNPWIGCQRVSPGCEHCYAEQATPTRVQRAKGLELWGPPTTTQRKRTSPDNWRNPLRWNAAAARDGVRRRMFVASLADVFENHPQAAEWRPYALAILAKCTSLDVQLLTKRPENIRDMVPPEWLESWPAHVWIGTTVEDQKRADQRIPHLLNVPAPVRFLSCEPLLESVDLKRYLGERHGCGGEVARLFCEECRAALGVQWVIVGGESGPDARVFRVEWARSILRQCRDAGVAAFVKQLGAVVESRLPWGEEWPGHSFGVGPVQFMGDGFGNFRARGLAHRAGADPAEWPADLRRQSFPEVHHVG